MARGEERSGVRLEARAGEGEERSGEVPFVGEKGAGLVTVSVEVVHTTAAVDDEAQQLGLELRRPGLRRLLRPSLVHRALAWVRV